MKILKRENSTIIFLEDNTRINIYFPQKIYGKLDTGGINWCTYGIKNIQKVKLFIAGLKKAIKIYKEEVCKKKIKAV